MVLGYKTHINIVGYVQALFKCVRCHMYGHLIADCVHCFKENVWKKETEQCDVGHQIPRKEGDKLKEAYIYGGINSYAHHAKEDKEWSKDSN
jgi:hypothetical protein